jgi:hypothetical protein
VSRSLAELSTGVKGFFNRKEKTMADDKKEATTPVTLEDVMAKLKDIEALIAARV